MTGLTAGTYIICAVPIGTTVCQTITVSQVVEAGTGGSGIVLMAGLVLGLLIFGLEEKKCKKGYKPVRIKGKDVCVKK